MTVVAMSHGELSRYDTLLRFERGELRVEDAAMLLGICRRQVYRLLRRLRADGHEALVSWKRGRSSNRDFGDAFRTRVLDLVREHYRDFGPTLAVEYGLRSLGVRIALDDFGTGYSSLSYLQSFPFDKIKIDRSFIQALTDRPGAAAIIKAITDLAGALGMETTAEGVEDSEQLAQLKAQGCTSAEGFLFSRPIAAGDVAGIVAAQFAEPEGKQNAA